MHRPREITAAAVVAFVGSGLFILAGLILAASVAIMLHSISQKYPGVSFRNAGPDFREVMRIIGYGIAIPVVLGVIGIITGRGLLRLKPWARKSAIAWSIGSSLLCLAALAHPQFKSGVRLNPAGILALMLFLFPINAWWLMLFFRPATKSIFTLPGTAPRIVERPEWLRENFMAKSIIVVAVLLLFAVGAGLMLRRNSPMREIERSRDALAAVKSWHFHSVRYFPPQPAETVDTDTICPSFQRSTNSWEDANGQPQSRDSIRYFTNVYNYVGGHWVIAPQSRGTLPDIPECTYGPMNMNENSLNYSGVIEDGTVRRGELKDVNGESCREYYISVPTPHDPAEKEYQFTVCINEQDHLPRETRHTAPGSSHEGVSTFGQWNAMSEPQLPPEISK
jgi:hypothetical protein